MSIQAVAWAISQRVGSPTGKVLLVCLANYANERGECWPSQRTISQEAELGERATRDWLKKLEEEGFIERHRRNRSDGSRTSDLIILHLSKQANPDEETLPADFAARPNLPASGSKPTGISCRLGRHDVPGIEPSLKPSIEPSTGARALGGNGFDMFWEEWPAKERPKKRQAAKWSFDRLSFGDQASAIKHAGNFRKLSKTREDAALMIPYLKERLFEEIEDAPQINADGLFVITPERPEWIKWLEWLETKHSSDARDNISKLGFFKVTQRWPSKSQPNESRLAS